MQAEEAVHSDRGRAGLHNALQVMDLRLQLLHLLRQSGIPVPHSIHL